MGRYTVDKSEGKRIEGLTFTKTFSDGKMYSYLMVSNKKGTLTVKTVYMDKADYITKGKKISLHSWLIQKMPYPIRPRRGVLQLLNRIYHRIQKMSTMPYQT